MNFNDNTNFNNLIQHCVNLEDAMGPNTYSEQDISLFLLNAQVGGALGPLYYFLPKYSSNPANSISMIRQATPAAEAAVQSFDKEDCNHHNEISDVYGEENESGEEDVDENISDDDQINTEVLHEESEGMQEDDISLSDAQNEPISGYEYRPTPPMEECLINIPLIRSDFHNICPHLTHQEVDDLLRGTVLKHLLSAINVVHEEVKEKDEKMRQLEEDNKKLKNEILMIKALLDQQVR